MREHPLLNKVEHCIEASIFSIYNLVLLSNAFVIPSVSFSSAVCLIFCVCCGCVQNVTGSGVCFVRDHVICHGHVHVHVHDDPSGGCDRPCVSGSRGHGLVRGSCCEIGSVISSFCCCYVD